MSAKAVLRSGKRNVKPYSRKRLGIERRPVKARLGSVLKMKAPIFTAHDGVGGAQGRCKRGTQGEHEFPVRERRRAGGVQNPGNIGFLNRPAEHLVEVVDVNPSNVLVPAAHCSAEKPFR